MPDNQRFVILGAGGHGRVVADCIRARSSATLLGFIDHDASKWGKHIDGIPILGNDDAIPSDTTAVGLGIGASTTRLERLRWSLSQSLHAPNIVHPAAWVSSAAMLADGCVVMAGAVVQAGVTLGAACIVNTSASIDHDCILEDGVHVAPGAHLAGNVRVGSQTHVGIGATVIEGINIGTNCFIAAGAVVVRNLADGERVAGVPARPMPPRSSP